MVKEVCIDMANKDLEILNELRGYLAEKKGEEWIGGINQRLCVAELPERDKPGSTYSIVIAEPKMYGYISDHMDVFYNREDVARPLAEIPREMNEDVIKTHNIDPDNLKKAIEVIRRIHQEDHQFPSIDEKDRLFNETMKGLISWVEFSLGEKLSGKLRKKPKILIGLSTFFLIPKNPSFSLLAASAMAAGSTYHALSYLFESN